MNSKVEFRSSPKFKFSCLGGTFDHLHKGHKVFLEKGFEVAQKVIIGLTSNRFTKDKILPQVILPFNKRKKELKKFLKKQGFLERAEIIKIEGPFTPRILDPEIECLVVSEKTKREVEPLNQKRIESNLASLEVVVVPMIVNKDGECISAIKIRLGKMDRKGEVFVKKKFFQKTFVLPQKLRPVLKRPLGELILGSEKDSSQAALKFKRRLKQDFCSLRQPELARLGSRQARQDSGFQAMRIPKPACRQAGRVRNDKKGVTPIKFLPTILVTVGDMVTLSLIKEGIVPNLSIVDFKVGRKQIYQDITQLGFSSNIRVKETINKPGTLDPELFKTIKKEIKSSLISKEPLRSIRHPELVSEPTPNLIRGSIKKGIPKPVRSDNKCVSFTSVIKVLGEEDLAVLPAVLLSPLSSLILYGQPKKGIVAIEVTEEKKKEIKRVVRQFQEKERA